MSLNEISLNEWLLDGLIMFALIWLAIRVLIARDLFKSVFLFIVFGLLMALAWVRLKAPDIALAEAAIGAGLTGVLLLDAVRHTTRPRKAPPSGLHIDEERHEHLEPIRDVEEDPC